MRILPLVVASAAGTLRGHAQVHRRRFAGMAGERLAGLRAECDVPADGQLVKYRLGGRARPYLAGGPTVRTIGPIRALGERIAGATRKPIETTEPGRRPGALGRPEGNW